MHSDDRHPDPPPAPPPGPPAGVPSDYDEAGRPGFDYVRDRIEGRYATSVGATELAGEAPQAKSLQEQLDEREKAAKDKLDRIRESLHRDGGDGGTAS